MNLFIINKNKEKLKGILEKNSNSNEIIIICHGSRGHKNAGLQKYLGKELSKKYNTFRFDFSGNGESDGKIENATYLKGISDIESVITFLSKEYQIKTIIGYSKSSSEILLNIKNLEKIIPRIILLAPRLNLLESSEIKLEKEKEKELTKNGYYIFPSTIKQKITKNYLEEIKSLPNLEKKFRSKIPILLIHGIEDSTIPIEKSEIFSQKNKNIELFKVKTNHLFREQNILKQISKKIINFLD